MFPMLHPRATAAVLLATALAAITAGCGSDDDNSKSAGTTASSSGEGAKIALLLPENKTARYENQDKPFFTAKVKELCPDCEVIYENATQDAAKQQQQAEAVITRGAKVLVLDAVDVASAGSIVTRAKQANDPRPQLRSPRRRRPAGLLRVHRPLQGRPCSRLRCSSKRSRPPARPTPGS